MLDALINQTSIPLLEQLARFGERRQEILAGNLANIDTPGYRMQDLPVEEFRDALRQAVYSRESPQALSLSGPALSGSTLSTGGFSAGPASAPGQGFSLTAQPDMPHPPSLERLFPEELFRAVESPPENLTFQDANNRSIEAQSMEMVRNSMLQHYAVQVMNSQLRMLETVITESVLT